MSEKLKPCPFCGANEPAIEEDTIHCLDCGVTVSGWDGCDGHLGAPEIWNSRPTEKAAREEVLEGVKITIDTMIYFKGTPRLGLVGNKVTLLKFMRRLIIDDNQLRFYHEQG